MSVDDPCYRDLVDRLMLEHKVDFIFEEASGHMPTYAEELALPHLGPNRYLDVDPPRGERDKHGLSADTGEDYLIDWDPPEPPCVARCEDIEEHAAREKFWLERIVDQHFERALMVCGHAHILTFAFRLKAIASCVKSIYYMPHHKLCTKPHTGGTPCLRN